MDMVSLFLGGFVANYCTNGKYLLHELSILGCAVLAIFSDQFLSSHLGLVLYACFGFLFTCQLLILSKMTVLKPNSSAAYKNPRYLRDTDFDFEDGCQVKFSCHEFTIEEIFKNAYEFSKFRPVYGILMIVGFIILIISCAIRMIVVEDQNLKEDLHCASLGLVVPCLFLIGVPLIVANVGIYAFQVKTDLYSYRPFQEVVNVPLKVVAGKALACFLTGACTSVLFAALLVGFVVSVFCSLVFLYHMTETDIEKMQTEYGMRVIMFKDVRKLLVGLLAGTTMAGSFHLSNRISLSWSRARRSIFGVIEKNWRQNLRAIDYLLQGAEVTSLEDLQAALDAKRTEQLTDGEKRAFNYVDWPLWQTKRPFFVSRTRIVENDVEPDNEIAEVPAQQRNVEPAEDQHHDEQAAGNVPEHQPAIADAELVQQVVAAPTELRPVITDDRRPVEQAVAAPTEHQPPVIADDRRPVEQAVAAPAERQPEIADDHRPVEQAVAAPTEHQPVIADDRRPVEQAIAAPTEHQPVIADDRRPVEQAVAAPTEQQPVIADDRRPIEQAVATPSQYQLRSALPEHRVSSPGPLRVTPQRKSQRRRQSGEYHEFIDERAAGEELGTLSPIQEQQERDQQAGTSRSVFRTPAPVEEESALRRSRRIAELARD